MLRFLPVFLSGIFLGIVIHRVVWNGTDGPEPSSLLTATAAAPPTLAAQTAIAPSRRNAIVRAVEKVSPAVVGVHTTFLNEYQGYYRDPFWSFFYYPGIVQEKTPGLGSGFVIRSDGHILTNHHVVKGAREISIVFPDGRRFNVTDIRNNVLIDWETDLAVIHIDADGLPVVDLGNADDVIIGEWAISIGNPFGLEIEDPKPTVTVGVISAIGRNFQSEADGRVYQDMIQTDASINPGNSGGPLVNSLGEVIGVNTFIFSKSGGSLGIGFAIPIYRAMEVVRRLIEGGDFWTGFVLHPKLTPWVAGAIGLATYEGALITRVEDNSPAARAQLNPGDLIVRINDRQVKSKNDAEEAFREGRIGEVFSLQILRGRRRLKTELVLEQAPLNR